MKSDGCFFMAVEIIGDDALGCLVHVQTCGTHCVYYVPRRILSLAMNNFPKKKKKKV